jgi:hypothetical protein
MADKDEADQNGAERPDHAQDPADRGPGAHSGGEEQARPQVVPGVASGAEGYTTGGTGAGEPLRGVRADDGDQEPGTEEGTARGENEGAGNDDKQADGGS